MIIIYERENGPRTDRIQKRLVISEEKVGVSLSIVGREFSLHIQLGITEDKQSTQASEAGCQGTSYTGMDMEVQGF